MKNLKIKKHYENGVFKGRSFYKDGVYFTITFGRNSSYDLYYNGDFVCNKKSYKEMINYVKDMK